MNRVTSRVCSRRNRILVRTRNRSPFSPPSPVLSPSCSPIRLSSALTGFRCFDLSRNQKRNATLRQPSPRRRRRPHLFHSSPETIHSRGIYVYIFPSVLNSSQLRYSVTHKNSEIAHLTSNATQEKKSEYELVRIFIRGQEANEKSSARRRSEVASGGSMIHVFIRNRVKTRRKAIKIKRW